LGWVDWARMRRATGALLLALTALSAAGCRKLAPKDLDAVRALRARALPRFQPPADGVVTDAQLDAYVKFKRAAGNRSEADTAAALGADPAEMAWVRARIVEGLLALEARQVTDAVFDSYGSAIARLRETRRSERDTKVAARLDAEIAGLERERATLRKGDSAGAAAAKNAARIAPRRAELAALVL
jgi:hypothetical protein